MEMFNKSRMVIYVESFEITFFCKKQQYNPKTLDVFYSNLKHLREHGLKCKKYIIEVFEEEERDFVDIRLSIFDLIITEDSFLEIAKILSIYVDVIFNKIENLNFATGVYELTYYLTQKLKCISEFNSSIFEKFPIVFFRLNKNYNQGEILFENNDSICVFNENTQKLF